MGNEKDIKSQRYDESRAPREMVPEPGRKTLVEQPMMPAQAGSKTGSAFVDKGAACEGGATSNGCFLSDAQRDRLLLLLQGRVLAAQTNYVAALVELRVDELLKKEPEKSDFMIELMIDIIVAVTVPALGRAVKALRSGAAHVAEMNMENPDAITSVLRTSTGDKQIEMAIKNAVNLGKKSVTKGMVAGSPESHDQKAANVAFIDILKDSSASIYQHIREDTIASADDAAITMLFQAFDSEMGHTVGAYKEALQEKLKRFEKSHVGEIGLTERKDKIGVRDLEGNISSGWWQWDTRAFWVDTPAGRRLGLYRRDAATAFSGDDDINKRFQEQIAAQNAQQEFKFLRYVPIEFEEVALAMHRAQWKAEPEERKASGTMETASAWVTV